MPARIRRLRPRPSDRWHLDEVFIRIGGKIDYLWRAVDDEREVLDRVCHVDLGTLEAWLSDRHAAEVFRNRGRNCWPWVRSMVHSPEAVTHSPAEIIARVAERRDQVAMATRL